MPEGCLWQVIYYYGGSRIQNHLKDGTWSGTDGIGFLESEGRSGKSWTGLTEARFGVGIRGGIVVTGIVWTEVEVSKIEGGTVVTGADVGE